MVHLMKQGGTAVHYEVPKYLHLCLHSLRQSDPFPSRYTEYGPQIAVGGKRARADQHEGACSRLVAGRASINFRTPGLQKSLLLGRLAFDIQCIGFQDSHPSRTPGTWKRFIHAHAAAPVGNSSDCSETQRVSGGQAGMDGWRRGNRGNLPSGPTSSIGSPITFMIRPRVGRPTGICKSLGETMGVGLGERQKSFIVCHDTWKRSESTVAYHKKPMESWRFTVPEEGVDHTPSPNNPLA